jgi:hypothetical protein
MVCFILRWVVSSVPFLSVCFKAKFCQSRATSAMASAAAHGSMPSALVQCTCLPHHGQFQERSIYFILRWGVSLVSFSSVHFKVNFTNQGQCLPWPLLPPVVVCCPFWCNASACNIMGDTGHAHFFLFGTGG